jgi:hypothetical protein
MRLFGRLKPHERREDDDSRKVYYQLGAFSECKAGDERADLYLRAARAICGLTCRYVEGLQSRIVSSGCVGVGVVSAPHSEATNRGGMHQDTAEHA